MPAPLEDTMTWEELCEHTFKKIRHSIPARDHKTFKLWFMERETIGYRFDAWMVVRCFKIWQELKNNLDHFIVISGREGFGKSTMAVQLMAWIVPDFAMDGIVYSAYDYTTKLSDKLKEYQNDIDKNMRISGMILDEGTELLSRESLKRSNIVLTKSFIVQRVLKFCVIVCIPNFHMLDSVMRYHRVRTLIEITRRGRYKAVTGKGIKIVAKEGLKEKQVDNVRIPEGTWWEGQFRIMFPKTIDYEEYNEHKLKSVGKLLDDMKDDAMSKKYVTVAKVSKEVGCKSDTIINQIKKGKVEGKQIASKWYLTKEAYDKLMTV